MENSIDLKKIERFIDKQKVSFICSIDGDKCPNVCVPKFTATSGRYYCDLKTTSFEIK